MGCTLKHRNEIVSSAVIVSSRNCLTAMSTRAHEDTSVDAIGATADEEHHEDEEEEVPRLNKAFSKHSIVFAKAFKVPALIAAG